MVRPTKFEITASASAETATLGVLGELDIATVGQLAESVNQQLADGAKGVTLDLSELSFMDSSGLRLLIDLYDRSRADSWRLRLIAPQHEAAALVLRATGADEALPFVEAEEP